MCRLPLDFKSNEDIITKFEWHWTSDHKNQQKKNDHSFLLSSPHENGHLTIFHSTEPRDRTVKNPAFYFKGLMVQQLSDAKNMLRNFNCLQDFRPAYIMFSPLRAILSICNQMSLGNCRWPELEKKIHAEWHPCIGWKNQLAAKRISAWCKGAEMVKSESEDGHSNHGLSSDIKFISITLIDFKYSQLDSYS